MKIRFLRSIIVVSLAASVLVLSSCAGFVLVSQRPSGTRAAAVDATAAASEWSESDSWSESETSSTPAAPAAQPAPDAVTAPTY